VREVKPFTFGEVLSAPRLNEARELRRTFNGIADAALLEVARAAAMAAIEDYGDDDRPTLDRMRDHGIWNDHIAVQAALCALKMAKQ
jgi:hypothetical protein